MIYTYKKSRSLSLISGTSLILNLEFRNNKKTAKIRGQLQTLFGDPLYEEPNPDNAYCYVIIMENEQGVRYNLTVCLSKFGTSIGGNKNIEGIEDAVQELKQYIEKAAPSDYEYRGTYSNGSSVIMGVKDEEPYYHYSETQIKKKAKKREPTFEEIFTRAGLIPEWIERGRVQGMETVARNALAKGLPVDVIHDITGMDIETIKKTEPIIEEQMEKTGLEAYLYTVITVNPEAFLEAREGSGEEFEYALMQAGIIPEWIEHGREQGEETVARNALVKGLPIDVIHDITGLSINKINKLAMNNA